MVSTSQKYNFPYLQYGLFLKILVTVSVKGKNLCAKQNGFHLPENVLPLAEMKDFVEKYFSTRRNKNHYWQEPLKNGEKIVSTSRKLRFL